MASRPPGAKAVVRWEHRAATWVAVVDLVGCKLPTRRIWPAAPGALGLLGVALGVLLRPSAAAAEGPGPVHPVLTRRLGTLAEPSPFPLCKLGLAASLSTEPAPVWR
jgi:hypothetical protein